MQGEDNRRLFHTAMLLALTVALSKAVGLIRDMMIAHAYGTGSDAVAYDVAAQGIVMDSVAHNYKYTRAVFYNNTYGSTTEERYTVFFLQQTDSSKLAGFPSKTGWLSRRWKGQPQRAADHICIGS